MNYDCKNLGHIDIPKSGYRDGEFHWMLGRVEPQLEPYVMAGRILRYITELQKSKPVRALRIAGVDWYYRMHLDEVIDIITPLIGMPVIKMDIAKYEQDRPYVPVRPKDGCICTSCKRIDYKHNLPQISGSFGRDSGVFLYECEPCAMRRALREQMWGPN